MHIRNWTHGIKAVRNQQRHQDMLTAGTWGLVIAACAFAVWAERQMRK